MPPSLRLARRQAGFNLIELIIGLSVAAILLAVAMPSFTEMFERNRMASVSNQMMTAVATARSQAIQHATPARLCASSDQSTCSGTWANGWIVSVDLDRDGAVDANETVLTGTIDPKVSISAAATNVVFTARGRSTSFNMTMTATDCEAGRPWRYRLAVLPTGGTNVTKQVCP